MDPKRLVYVVVGCLCIMIAIFAEEFHTTLVPTWMIPHRIGRLCFSIVGIMLILVGLFARF